MRANRIGGAAGPVSDERRTSLRPDEVAEEEGDHEDDQEDLREQEEDDADPEADADFLFEVHAARVYKERRPEGRVSITAPERP
jgi:hypothetical protein